MATGNASTMARRVKDRDNQQCWVTRWFDSNTNSHVCPKRHLFRIIYREFVGPLPPGPALSINQEICGITLNDALDTLFDKYERRLAPVRTRTALY